MAVAYQARQKLGLALEPETEWKKSKDFDWNNLDDRKRKRNEQIIRQKEMIQKAKFIK